MMVAEVPTRELLDGFWPTRRGNAFDELCPSGGTGPSDETRPVTRPMRA
jgi:hypothetical protein